MHIYTETILWELKVLPGFQIILCRWGIVDRKESTKNPAEVTDGKREEPKSYGPACEITKGRHQNKTSAEI